MNTDRLVRTFQELVSIDSPSFDERRMADELAGRLKELGFAVSEDGAGEYYGGTAGNLYAYREGTLPGEPLLFSTHMDTVEPARGKRAVLRGDGRIESGGDTVLGADCMTGTAALLEALAELKEEGKDFEEVSFDFQYDIASFLQHYAYAFSLAGLERITGINQKQLSHYISGYRHPSEKTVRKIESSIRKFSQELSSVHFA